MSTTDRSKAVAYIRVSSDEQAEAGVSLDAQAAKLTAYGQVRGFELVDVISDPAVSGHTPLGERAGGRRLLDLVEAGMVEHVLAVKLDRLFRNTLNCLQLVDIWSRQGVGLHILDMGGNAVDTSSAMGKMFLTMAAGFAEMERNLIAERTRAALERKRERGERLGGHLPYGYEVAAGSKQLLMSQAASAPGAQRAGHCRQARWRRLRDAARRADDQEHGGQFAQGVTASGWPRADASGGWRSMG